MGKYTLFVHFMFMLYSSDGATPADPASHEPSQARPASRDYEEGGREPDPTDFFIRIMKRLAVIGMERMEEVRERSQAARAARQAAAETAPPERDDDVGSEMPTRRAAQDRTDLEYQRITRAMRLCAALALKFHNERLDRDMKKTAEDEAAAQKRRSRLRSQVERLVKEAIVRDASVRDADERDADERDSGDEEEDEESDEDEERDGSLDAYYLGQKVSERLYEDDIERDLERCSVGELVARVCRGFGVKPAWEIWKDQFWALEEARLRTPGSPYAAPPAAPEPEKPRPEAAKPPGPAPDDAKPEDPEPPEARVEEPEPEVPKPEVPAEPPMRNIDWFRTPEHQRELEEHGARMRARIYNGL